MRHAGDLRKMFAWCVALFTSGACGALHHSSGSYPAEPALAKNCAFAEPPPAHGATDTATIVFDAADIGAEACALRLVAEALRPWPTSSNDRWTVEIVLTEVGATAHRLRGEGARDAIDAGGALIATDDLDLLAYAAARPTLEVSALPWDRTYFRLAPGGRTTLGTELVLDAVRVDARQVETPSCDTVMRAGTTPSARAPSARVVYDAGDRTARELAERVVALAGSTATAVGLDRAEMDVALRAGNDLAFIVSEPRSAGHECDVNIRLAHRAPWLAPEAIVPLIETRAHAIVPRIPRP